MRRTNLIKKVACCAMILVMTGSTVMAGTVSRSQKVRNVTTYTNSYSGTAGNYCAAGDSSKARTSIQIGAGERPCDLVKEGRDPEDLCLALHIRIIRARGGVQAHALCL